MAAITALGTAAVVYADNIQFIEPGIVVVDTPVIYAKVIVTPSSRSDCASNLKTVDISKSGVPVASVALGEEAKIDLSSARVPIKLSLPGILRTGSVSTLFSFLPMNNKQAVSLWMI